MMNFIFILSYHPRFLETFVEACPPPTKVVAFKDVVTVGNFPKYDLERNSKSFLLAAFSFTL
jgi:hypothetical protein